MNKDLAEEHKSPGRNNKGIVYLLCDTCYFNLLSLSMSEALFSVLYICINLMKSHHPPQARYHQEAPFIEENVRHKDVNLTKITQGRDGRAKNQAQRISYQSLYFLSLWSLL